MKFFLLRCDFILSIPLPLNISTLDSPAWPSKDGNYSTINAYSCLIPLPCQQPWATETDRPWIWNSFLPPNVQMFL